MQPLRLLQHLPVAASKLSQHSISYMGNALRWVTQGAPQGLEGKCEEEGGNYAIKCITKKTMQGKVANKSSLVILVIIINNFSFLVEDKDTDYS